MISQAAVRIAYSHTERKSLNRKFTVHCRLFKNEVNLQVTYWHVSQTKLTDMGWKSTEELLKNPAFLFQNQSAFVWCIKCYWYNAKTINVFMPQYIYWAKKLSFMKPGQNKFQCQVKSRKTTSRCTEFAKPFLRTLLANIPHQFTKSVFN